MLGPQAFMSERGVCTRRSGFREPAGRNSCSFGNTEGCRISAYSLADREKTSFDIEYYLDFQGGKMT